MTTEFPIFKLNDFLGDIYGLQSVSTGASVKKGLKDQALSVPIKQHLKRLGVEIQKEKNLYDESVKEILSLPETAQQNLKALNETKVSISHFDFKDSDFSSLVCEEDYLLLDYLLPVDEQINKVD
jgi:hypothetical protein